MPSTAKATMRARERVPRFSAAERRELAALYEEKVGWMLEPWLRMAGDIEAAAANPASTNAKLEAETQKNVERRLAQVGEDAFIGDLIGDWLPEKFVRALRVEFPLRLERERRRLARNPVKDGLLRLMTAAHARVAYSPILAFHHPQAAFEPALHAVRKARELKGATGLEDRALVLADTLAAYADRSYLPYLEQVYLLARLCEGVVARPRRRMTLGQLVRDLKSRVATFGPIIDPECARVRNAVRHNGARWDSKARVLELRDSEHWSKRMSVKDIRSMLTRMTAHVTAFDVAKGAFLYLALAHGGVWDRYFRFQIARRRKDEGALEQIEREWQAWEKNLHDAWDAELRHES